MFCLLQGAKEGVMSGASYRVAETLALPVAVEEGAQRSVAAAVSQPLVANTCALCGQADGELLFKVDGFAIVRCLECGLAYTRLRPATVSSLYEEGYYNSLTPKGGYSNYFAGAAINRLTFKARLREIEERFGGRGRILDVGCALGDFLVVAREAGWDTWGVEVSAWASDFARRHNGLRVHAGSLEEAGFPSGSFDVVTLYDVIEHAEDPVGLLGEVRRVLAPGGLVHIVTPNVGGKLAGIFGRRWYHYKPGEHLYYFSPATITKAMELAGLKPGGCSPIGSVMTPAYVLDRLRYYNAPLADGLCAALRLVRLAELPVYVRAGEMQAWGRRGD